MAKVEFNFDTNSFNTIFPFHILIDADLKIISIGKSLPKVLPKTKLNAFFYDEFNFITPQFLSLDKKSLTEATDQIVIIESLKNDQIQLRGQIEINNGNFLFIGSPWFSTIEELVDKKMDIKNFAYHDPLHDMLQVLKNQEINNTELKDLLKIVNDQRKKLKKDKEQLNLLSLVASSNNNGIIFTNHEGKIFWCNEAYIKLTGYSLEEITGKTPIEIGRSELSSNDEIHKMINAFYKGENIDIEIKHYKKDGTTFWAKSKGQPLFNEYGKVVRYFATIEDVTLEKQKEEQLALLSSIAEKNSNAVVICNNLGKIEWINPSFTKLSGYTLDEIIDKTPGSFLQGPDSDPETINFMNHKIKNGEPFTTEIINYHKSKQKYWVRIQAQVINNAAGEVTKYFAIQENITNEKEHNKQLIDSENRLKSLIVNLQSGILLEDENRNVLIANQKFCDMFSLGNPEDLKGLSCLTIVKKTSKLYKNSNVFLSRKEEIVEAKKEIIAEEIELKDGRVLERSYIPIIRNNEFKGHLWSYDDVTIKKKYKENLENEKDKYRSIIDNMNMGLIEVDLNDKIQLANQSFCDMSGYSILDLLDNKASDLLLDPESKKILKNKEETRSNGISDSYEVVAKTKNGEKKYWLVSGAPNYNVNGEMVGSIGIHLDITEQKNLEIQKEQLLSRLEKQNEQLNEYAQIVSHDLKSPLRSINSLLSWIKEDNDKEFSEQTTQYLDMIENKVEKMDHLIQGILTYSKVDTIENANEKVDVNEIINNIINIIHIPENVSVKINNKLPELLADKYRIQQLFQNIIGNAVTYIDKPEGIVEIASTEDTTHYTFSIKDNGPGIAKENQEKIFKIFQSFTNHEKSTGIGLSIVKRIVDNYNGKIWIESELEKGTTFFIKLPKN